MPDSGSAVQGVSTEPYRTICSKTRPLPQRQASVY